MAEKVLADGLRQFGLANAGRTDEQEDAQRTVWIIEASLKSHNQVSPRIASPGLADHLFVQFVEHRIAGEPDVIPQKRLGKAGLLNEAWTAAAGVTLASLFRDARSKRSARNEVAFPGNPW